MSDKELENLTDEKLATQLDTSVQKVKTAIEVDRRKKVISLDEVVKDSENDASIGELTPAYDYNEFVEKYDIKIELDDIIKRLPQELKEMITLFYYEDMKQKDIAEKFGMNEMMVSRKLKKAYSLMYKYIKNSSFMD